MHGWFGLPSALVQRYCVVHASFPSLMCTSNMQLEDVKHRLRAAAHDALCKVIERGGQSTPRPDTAKSSVILAKEQGCSLYIVAVSALPHRSARAVDGQLCGVTATGRSCALPRCAVLCRVLAAMDYGSG